MREFQAMDELAMYFTILAHLYCMINMQDDIESKKYPKLAFLRCNGLFPSVKAAVSAYILSALFIFSCIIYELLSPVVFQTFFGISVVIGVYLSVLECKKKYNVTDEKQKAYLAEARRNKIIMLALVVGCSLVGFTAWRIDNLFCPNYEHLKLHSVWHLFTSYATYIWGWFAFYCHWISVYGRTMSNQNNNTEAYKVVMKWSLIPTAQLAGIEKVNRIKTK
jgi:hypothetical protein